MRVFSSDAVILLLIDDARVVADDHGDGMAVAAEVFIVGLHGFTDVAQAIGGITKIGSTSRHWWNCFYIPMFLRRSFLAGHSGRGRSRQLAAFLRLSGLARSRITARSAAVEGE